MVIPKVAKVEGAAYPRRQGCSCSNLPQALDNDGDAAPSAFPTCWVVAESEAQRV